MRIAIASSGLGHVARGIETWACDTAGALAQYAVSSEQGANVQVTLFCGDAGPTTNGLLPTIILPCLQRGNPTTQQLSNGFPGFTWRWGLKSTYDLEQWSFWWHLWPKLRRGKFDIAHVQDPWLARLLEVSRRRGLHQAKVILAHGTEEPLEFLEKFKYVQHLAPWHLSEAQKARRSRQSTVSRQQWTAMPNFVDCAVFHPVNGPSGKEALRAALGLPRDAFIVGCVAAVKKDHKRIDYLIREFAQWVGEKEDKKSISREAPSTGSGQAAKGTNGEIKLNIDLQDTQDRELTALSCKSCTSMLLPSSPYLLIAGAKTNETAELLTLAESLIPGHYQIVTDCARSRMPDLYRAMDVFVLPSLFEMMPIALLEALASGLPCLVNTHPVLEWMIGAKEGGMSLAMSQPGALTETLSRLTPEWLTLHGRQARERALQMFSTEAVISQYIAYYREVLRT